MKTASANYIATNCNFNLKQYKNIIKNELNIRYEKFC